MKIVFFELQDWEESPLKAIFPAATFTKEKLTSANVSNYHDAEIISCFIYSQIDKIIIDAMPNLKLISTRSTGFDHIDSEYCRVKNIKVANVPEYGSVTVAEHTFALILALTRKIYQGVGQAKRLDFDHQELRGIDLFNKTLGVIGLGKIGQHIIKIANGFGMKILVYTRTQNHELALKYNFEYSDLDNLISNSDIVTLHLPLNDQTKHIINKENILKFKKGGYLINTARGGLIETESIILGLEKDILTGVGLDVLEEEEELSEEAEVLTSEFHQKTDLKTLLYNHILLNHPKVLITPHNAFNSQEALKRISDTTISNINEFIAAV